jgi:hypothetical protein
MSNVFQNGRDDNCPDFSRLMAFESGNGDADGIRGGMPDELSVEALADDSSDHLHLRDELPDDAADVLADQTISAADDVTRNELAAAYARAKELAGTAKVKLGRQVTSDDYDGKGPRCEVTWTAIIDHGSFGVGDSPDEAVDAALANLDKTAGIKATASGGYFIPGKAIVTAATFRTPAEALALARRVAVNAEYLDALVRFKVPGVRTADGDTTPPVSAAIRLPAA